MFSSRRYERVSQHVESESDSDEATIFTAENGSSQKGDWNFGLRAYDLNEDLKLPKVRPRPIRQSKRSKDSLHGYTRKQALFGACVCIVIVTVITVLAVLFLMKQGSVAITNTDDCYRPPKPLENFADTDGGQPTGPTPCGRGKVTTEGQKDRPATPPGAGTGSEAEPEQPTPSSKGATNMSTLPEQPTPFLKGATNTSTQSLLTAHTEQPTKQETSTQRETTVIGSEAPPTALSSDKGDIMMSITSQLTEKLSTADAKDQDSTMTTIVSIETTTIQDEKLLNNWREKIASEVSTQTTTTEQPTRFESTESAMTPPTSTLAPPTSAHTTTSSTEMTSERSKVEPSVLPAVEPRSINWEHDFFPALSETTMELFDMNGDGVVDVLTVEDLSQCTGRVVAMDGQNGKKFWQKEVNFPAFGVRCELDVNNDGVKDCLVIGRGAGFAAIDSRDGSLLWEVDPSITFPPYNFYFPLIIEDLDEDGVNDIINVHGGDTSYKADEHERSPGFLVVVSGRTGQSLMPPLLTPDGHESYMSPVLFKLNGKDDLVLFGSGGETVPGSLWAVSLSSIRNQVVLQRARQSWKEGVYEPFVNDSRHPCLMKDTDFNKIRPSFDVKAFDFERPIFVTSASNSMRFCPRWEGVSPIWNKYNVCLYELYRSESKGVIVPPVMVDLNLDGIDDLVVSVFDGRTVALNGTDAVTKLWDVYYPNTESYRYGI